MSVLSHQNNILTHDGKDLFAPDLTRGNECYFGVIAQGERPSTVDLSALDRAILIIRDELTLEFSDTVGYIVFAIPFSSKPRIKWKTSPANNGPIGGSPTGVLSNLFPDPVYITYQGVYYRLYISSYQTRLVSPLTLIA